MPPFLGPLERLILIRDGFYSPDARTHTRAAAILALDYGHPLRRVARSVRCHRNTLYHWLDRYLEKRDVAALCDGRTRDVRRHTRRLKPARAAALLELARAAPPAEPGRLALGPAARDRLARLATPAEPDPARRYWAALLLAYDRGLLITDIARAAGCARNTVYEAPARHLPRLLADGAGQETAGPGPDPTPDDPTRSSDRRRRAPAPSPRPRGEGQGEGSPPPATTPPVG